MNYFRMGRVAGINIHVNWSWCFIFGLVSWSLSLTFAQTHPEWSLNLRWGVAMLAAFLFFLSVLAHELAHSLMALARGVPVSNITLFMLGGVSNMQREPATPAEEMVITIVGPLTSLFTGAVCLLAGTGGVVEVDSLIAPALLSPLQPLNTALAWLGSVNLMIGFFNLIPSFPLDGGRMVRSLLWAASKDMQVSTRWATWLGQAISWSMIFVGVCMAFGAAFPLLGSGIFNGLWLILIGAFLNSTAISAYRQSIAEDRRLVLPVRKAMQTRVPVIATDASLADLLRKDRTQPDGHILFVIKNQEVVGMVSLWDVKRLLRDLWPTATVGDIMTPVADLHSVSADEDLVDAFERLQRLDILHMPVKLNNRIVGLLHLTDVYRLLQLKSEPGV